MEIEENSILEKHNALEPWDKDPNFCVDNIYYRSDSLKMRVTFLPSFLFICLLNCFEIYGPFVWRTLGLQLFLISHKPEFLLFDQ